jgi:hypothetical protein
MLYRETQKVRVHDLQMTDDRGNELGGKCVQGYVVCPESMRRVLYHAGKKCVHLVRRNGGSPLVCPRCTIKMHVLAVVTDPAEVKKSCAT